MDARDMESIFVTVSNINLFTISLYLFHDFTDHDSGYNLAPTSFKTSIYLEIPV